MAKKKKTKTAKAPQKKTRLAKATLKSKRPAKGKTALLANSHKRVSKKKVAAGKIKHSHLAPEVGLKKRVSKRVEPKQGTGVVRLDHPVPNFTLPATGGREVTSDSLRGKKVVLYFYPKDSTPGCTIEGRDFSRLKEEFEKVGAIIFGVSRDSLKSHEKFKTKESFCFELLSDESGELTEMFGVWKEKKLYGRAYMGIERSTFLIDESGVLRREWRAVKVDGHAQEVLGETQTLSGTAI